MLVFFFIYQAIYISGLPLLLLFLVTIRRRILLDCPQTYHPAAAVVGVVSAVALAVVASRERGIRHLGCPERYSGGHVCAPRGLDTSGARNVVLVLGAHASSLRRHVLGLVLGIECIVLGMEGHGATSMHVVLSFPLADWLVLLCASLGLAAVACHALLVCHALLFVLLCLLAACLIACSWYSLLACLPACLPACLLCWFVCALPCFDSLVCVCFSLCCLLACLYEYLHYIYLYY